jgi:biopolymer transport protein ExbB/biopolymer transport protein TolQ
VSARGRLGAALLLGALVAPACLSSFGDASGASELFRVRGATFRAGALPGLAPSSSAPTPAGAPSITDLELVNGVVRPGQVEKRIAGRTSKEGASVALAFPDAATGYWVVPVDAPDPSTDGELSWAASFDLDLGAPPGLHPLRVVAPDGAGNAGAQGEFQLCVASPIPDNLNACDPKLRPPSAVISLGWDVPSDLDLRVVTPSGQILGAKTPSGGAAASGAPDPSAGVLDRDSNAACAPGPRRENVVFQGAPAAGTYLVYVSLFDACGQPATRWNVTLRMSQAGASAGSAGTYRQVEVLRREGISLAGEASGGANGGTYVVPITFDRATSGENPMIVDRLLRAARVGGTWVLYLLFALSILSLAAMAERWIWFRKRKADVSALRRKLDAALTEDDEVAALALLAGSASIEAEVLRSAMRWAKGGAEAFADVVESELGRVRKELERGMTFLGTLGSNAPFIGLFGTVLGVIEAFGQLGKNAGGGGMDNTMAAIGEALVATGVGLFVAIPAVVGYNVAQKRIGEIETDTQSLAKLISAWLKFRKEHGSWHHDALAERVVREAAAQPAHVIEIEREDASDFALADDAAAAE